MFCTKCGHDNADGAKFCGKCGYTLVGVIVEKDEVNKINEENKVTETNKPAETYKAPEINKAPETKSASSDIQGFDINSYQPKKSKFKIILPIIIIAIIGLSIFAALSASDNNSDKSKSKDNGKSASVADNGTSTASTSHQSSTTEPDNTPTPTPTPASSSSGKATRTVMIYMIGSNLESGIGKQRGGYASADIDEMLLADIPDDVNVILECGGSTYWDNSSVPDGEVTRFAIQNNKLVKLEELGSIAMTDSGSLSDFITFAATNYPAESYSIDFWDHGGGIPVGFGMDELAYDFYDLLTSYEIKAEMEKAGVHFDVAIFDACNVGTLEMGMALKDYCDYMIGAESTVAGNGLYYTSWLSQTGGDCQSFCETAALDYIDDIHYNGWEGSMSLIRLDKIDEVYDAYVNFISSVYSEMNSGGYEKYSKIRSEFNDFDSVDSIDLVTMATKYDNDYSSKLQNAVTNCVVWTEADMHSGHGITIYSPMDYTQYSEGRLAFSNLNYDNTVISFYDEFMSKKLAAAGSSEVSAYGGTWYNSSYSSGTSTASTYDLEVTDIGGVFATNSLNWDVIDRVEYYVATNNVAYPGVYRYYGCDLSSYVTDKNDRILFYIPDKWTWINDAMAYWYTYSYSENKTTGEYEYTGFIPVLLNGTYDVALYVKYSNDYPSGKVLGYVEYDLLNDELLSTNVYELSDTDTIVVAYKKSEENDSGDTTWTITYDTDTVTVGTMDLSKPSMTFIDGITVYGRIEVYDVYGNVYKTGWYNLVNK